MQQHAAAAPLVPAMCRISVSRWWGSDSRFTIGEGDGSGGCSREASIEALRKTVQSNVSAYRSTFKAPSSELVYFLVT